MFGACLLATAVVSGGIATGMWTAVRAQPDSPQVGREGSGARLNRVAVTGVQAIARLEARQPEHSAEFQPQASDAPIASTRSSMPVTGYHLKDEDRWQDYLRRHDSADARVPAAAMSTAGAESASGREFSGKEATADSSSGGRLVCEPNQFGSALINRPIPFGFVFQPDQYPDQRIELRNLQAEPLVVEVSADGVPYSVNGVPAAGNTTYPIGQGLEIKSDQALHLHVHPGTVPTPRDPQGNG